VTGAIHGCAVLQVGRTRIEEKEEEEEEEEKDDDEEEKEIP
jgi:hypothetical protein